MQLERFLIDGLWYCVVTFSLLVIVCGHEEEKEWTRDFAVELNADFTEAQLVANTHGFDVVREIPSIKVFHFNHPKACSSKHRCKRHAKDLVELLMNEPHVRRVEQQYVLERDRRKVPLKYLDRDLDAVVETPMPRALEEAYESEAVKRNLRIAPKLNDPLFEHQWHLNNYGQFDNPGLDMNVMPAWHKGYKGNGSRVAVVDDGIDTQHPDLIDNYDPILSADLNDPLDVTGNPRTSEKTIPDDEAHGTQCAGEIAAKANNKICGSGVAPEVALGGIRILAGKITDLLESYSILHQNQLIDIYSCSWGPKDNAKIMEMPHYYTGKALKYSATKGRRGLGNLFFYASGNGGRKGDNCGADAYVNAPYTIPMSAVNIYGRAVTYGERCSAVFLTVPVGGYPAGDAGGPKKSFPRIATCKINGRCTKRFVGTSAAAPLGAGCAALVLQANRNLTWRDAQHVFARSCRLPNPAQRVWQRNGAGFPVSHSFGFGLLDCSRAVRLAQTWKNVGPRQQCHFKVFRGKRRIYSKSKHSFRLHVPHCRHPKSKGQVHFIEHALLSFVIDHPLRGDVQLWVTSPRGTVSRLLGKRWSDRSRKGIKQAFLTRHLMGEDPRGLWTITVEDSGWHRTRRLHGKIRSVSLRIFGTREAPGGLKKNNGKSRKMSAREIRAEYHRGRMEALSVMPLDRQVVEMKRQMEAGNPKAVLAEVKRLRGKTLAKEDREALREVLKTLGGG